MREPAAPLGLACPAVLLSTQVENVSLSCIYHTGELGLSFHSYRTGELGLSCHSTINIFDSTIVPRNYLYMWHGDIGCRTFAFEEVQHSAVCSTYKIIGLANTPFKAIFILQKLYSHTCVFLHLCHKYVNRHQAEPVRLMWWSGVILFISKNDNINGPITPVK